MTAAGALTVGTGVVAPTNPPVPTVPTASALASTLCMTPNDAEGFTAIPKEMIQPPAPPRPGQGAGTISNGVVNAGGDPNPSCEPDANAKSDTVAMWSESLFFTGSPAIFCDDGGSPDGLTVAEGKCQQSVANRFDFSLTEAGVGVGVELAEDRVALVVGK